MSASGSSFPNPEISAERSPSAATTVLGVQCPSCRHPDTKVIDSRAAHDGAAIRRRRLCPECEYRFTTYERVELATLVVHKSDGRTEPFDRTKIVAGVLAACKGRPVDVGTIGALAEDVEDEIRLDGAETSSARIGLAVLNRLRRLDDVAYLRFASVYKAFDEAADFQREAALLQKLGASS
jgi:transcriptional repressor NrdR